MNMKNLIVKKSIFLFIGLLISAFVQAQTTILPANTVWKYKADGTNQGTTWRSTTFNDAAWSSGAAELGYGDAPVTTLTAYKITYYFRKTVSITNPSQYTDFTLKVRRDDGIIIYVNNVEVYRNNMPTGTISYTTRASTSASDDGATVFSTTLASSLFVNGNNVIAAEVHNRSTTSSDITFELQLLANGVTASCNIPDVALFETHNKTATSATAWWVPVTGAVSYNTEYRVRGVGANYSSPVNVTADSVNITGLQPSTNYEFIVQTVCAGGTSAFSSSGWFTTLAGTTCSTPSGLASSSITNTTATLSWGSVTGALSYNIQYRTIGSSSWTTTTSTTTSKAITGLVLGTSYEFQVQTVCSGGNSAFSSSSNFTTTGGGTIGVPQFSHIVVVIGENTNASSVFGSTNAPYINALAAAGASFTQSYAITHPSQPNYLQLYSGSNQGVTNDNVPSSHFTTANLGRELIDVGKTFTMYSEELPSVGSDVATSGGYARKHNPAANWMGTGTNQIPTTTNQPWTAFPTNYSNLPSVSFIAPNQCNDGHDVCAPYSNRVKQYDIWVQNNLDAYKQWCVNNNSLLIVTYDEDDGSGANRITTVFYGAHVALGSYSQTINHYNVLRFLEDANGITTHAGSAASASQINFCWASLRIKNIWRAPIEIDNNITVYPNPVSDNFIIDFKNSGINSCNIKIHNSMGQMCYQKDFSINNSTQLIINRNDILNSKNGIYFLTIGNEFGAITKKLILE